MATLFRAIALALAWAFVLLSAWSTPSLIVLTAVALSVCVFEIRVIVRRSS